MSNVINILRQNDSLQVPVDIIMAAAQDRAELAYLEGVLQTTMRMTKDDTTRRAIRIKLDALNSMRMGTTSGTMPSTIPTY